MKWNDKVLKLMKEQGLSQKQLAQKSGIAESSVSRYLKSNKRPRLDIVINFAKILGVKPEYLLDDDDIKEDAFTLISSAVARKGNELTPEEKYKLIAMIAGKESDV
ncbi:MAG: helix-turn-helix domain-containing protein [Clostridia bacterium]|nr:helix-turn-helix domain-containing protein [Clostridia bacterium]